MARGSVVRVRQGRRAAPLLQLLLLLLLLVLLVVVAMPFVVMTFLLGRAMRLVLP